MSPRARQLAIFVAGLSLGLLAAWTVMHLRAPPEPTPEPAGAALTAPPVEPAPAPVAAPAATVTGAPNIGITPRSACPTQTLTAVAGPKDGQFQLLDDLSGKTDKDISAFIVVGKEAAASGRTRDAEIAFLMSCRVAEALKGEGSLEAADARYQLGWHYANLALHGRTANRSELHGRAELMYSDSLKIFGTRHGQDHEKTRFAAEGLASLRQPPPLNGPGAVASPGRPTAPLAEKPSPPPARSGSAAIRPSFDCAKARSRPEKLICADPELARLDRELGRLYARARDAAADAGAFRRQQDRAWREREANCMDRECLLLWYAQRRRELNEALAQSRR